MTLPWRSLVAAALLLALAALPAAAEAYRCLACPDPINGGRYTYWLIEGRRFYAHDAHGEPAFCEFCNGVLGRYSPWGAGGPGPDGQMRCDGCLRTGVRDPRAAAQMVEAVRRRMQAWGMKFPWGQIPVRLVDPATLNGRPGGHPGISTLGVTTTKTVRKRGGGYEVTGLEILMLDAMPAAYFEKTAAHELTHAWMKLNGAPRDASLPFVEGACNLVAYYYLQTRGGAYYNQLRLGMLQNPDPVYGEGLRRHMKYVTDHRVRDLLKILPVARDFPPGY